MICRYKFNIALCFLKFTQLNWVAVCNQGFLGSLEDGTGPPFQLPLIFFIASSSSCIFVCCTQLDYILTSRIQRNVAYSDELYPKNCNCFGLKCMYQINLRISGVSAGRRASPYFQQFVYAHQRLKP